MTNIGAHDNRRNAGAVKSGIAFSSYLAAALLAPPASYADDNMPRAPQSVQFEWIRTEMDASTYPETFGKMVVTWTAGRGATRHTIEEMQPREKPRLEQTVEGAGGGMMRTEFRLLAWQLSALDNPFVVVRYRVCAVNVFGRSCTTKPSRGLEGIKFSSDVSSDDIAEPANLPPRQRMPQGDLTEVPDAIKVLVKPGKFGSKLMAR